MHECDAGLRAARCLHDAAAQQGSPRTVHTAEPIESSMCAPHPWPTDEQAQLLPGWPTRGEAIADSRRPGFPPPMRGVAATRRN